MRDAVRPAFQVADAPHAQPGPLGKLLLREGRLRAQVPQEFTKRRGFTAHRPGPFM
jgi:hypothetical protein